jgi:hypothetical protein
LIKSTSDCRLFILSEAMDGRGVSCLDLDGAERCDICEPDKEIFLAAMQMTLEKPLRQPLSPSSSVNLGGITDDMIAKVDLSFVLEHQKGLPGTLIATPPFVSSPASTSRLVVATPTSHSTATNGRSQTQQFATSITLPTSSKPSMPIQMDAALHHQYKQQKLAKAKIISDMARFLLGRCYVCCFKTGANTKKTPNHNYFVSCENPPRYNPNAMGWMSLKRSLQFAKYQYCHFCGLPQNEFLPSCHPPFEPGRNIVCPLEDLVAVICWHVFIHKDIYIAAREKFTDLALLMSSKEFGIWVNTEPGPGSFYNGLELALWLWLRLRQH